MMRGALLLPLSQRACLRPLGRVDDEDGSPRGTLRVYNVNTISTKSLTTNVFAHIIGIARPIP